MQREKIVSINGLKGFSCIIIMLYHYRFFWVNNGIEIINYGHYFVEVFVTISGFLMAYNYRNRISGMNFRDFFVKRYLKIMPLYWITEICMYVAEILAVFLTGKSYQRNPIQVLLEFSGLYTGWFGEAASPLNSPLWTVNCLLLCYFSYYFICRICRRSYCIYISVILGSLVGGLCVMWYIPQGIYAYIGNEDSLRCILCFLGGLVLYELYRKISEEWGQIIGLALGALLMGAIVYSAFCLTHEIYKEKALPSIVILLFCPFILYSAIFIKPLKFLYSTKVLQAIGELSMDIYMWHWVVRVYMGSRPFYLDDRTLGGWIVLVSVTLSISILSHYILMPWIYKMGNKVRQIYIKNIRKAC